MPDEFDQKNENERKYKVEMIRLYSNIAQYFIRARYNLILTVATLTAAILIISTFDREILPLTCGTKFLLIALLFIILLCVFFYTLYLWRSPKTVQNTFDKILGVSTKNLKSDEKCFDKFIAIMPYALSILLCIFLLIIIYLIWKNSGCVIVNLKDIKFILK